MAQTQQFQQTDRQKIVVKAAHYRKRHFVDVRIWFLPMTVPVEDGTPEDWQASKKGVQVGLEDAQPVAQAIVDIADDMAREIEASAGEEEEANG